MYDKSVKTLGLWSSGLSFFFSVTLTLAGVLGMAGVLTKHWENLLVFGLSLMLAFAYVIMMVTVHYTAPVNKKLWSHLGIVFAAMYATFVSLVYIVMLFVVEPSLVSRNTENIKPFIFDKGSFTQIVDGLGYTLMGISTLFAAFVFKGDKKGKWVYWFFIANGISSLPVAISYITYNILIGVPWVIAMPGAALALAFYYKKND